MCVYHPIRPTRPIVLQNQIYFHPEVKAVVLVVKQFLLQVRG